MRLLLITTLFILPVITSAVTSAELQAQIQMLLERIRVVKQQIAIEESKYGVIHQIVSDTNDLNGCIQLFNNLKRGSRGQAVTDLQNFLVKEGVYSPMLITGYFGPATELGVQRFQENMGIVSYGSPESTGYGLVGPSTRSAINTMCVSDDGIQNVIVEKYSLSVNPQKGLIPHRVQANFVINGSWCTSYQFDWGDGSSVAEWESNQTNDCGSRDINKQLSHIYTRPGIYTARFKTGKSLIEDIKTVESIVITAGDVNFVGNHNFRLMNNTGVAPTPIAVRFEMYGDECVSYSVNWGDGSAIARREAEQNAVCRNNKKTREITHTYTKRGTHTITFRIGKNKSVSELPIITTKTVVIE